MAEKKYLIDTNTAIEYIGGLLPDKALTEIDNIIDVIQIMGSYNLYKIFIVNDLVSKQI